MIRLLLLLLDWIDEHGWALAKALGAAAFLTGLALLLAGCDYNEVKRSRDELADRVVELEAEVQRKDEAIEQARDAITRARDAIENAPDCAMDQASEAEDATTEAEDALDEAES